MTLTTNVETITAYRPAIPQPLYNLWQKTSGDVVGLALYVARQKLIAHGRISISCQFVNYTAILQRTLQVTPSLSLDLKIVSSILKALRYFAREFI